MSLYKNILYIEDDEDDQILFEEAMRDIGDSMHCSLANNGKEALEKLKTSLDLPDIIFLDINMPLMNGFEFIKHLKAEQSFCKIPVVILSTSTSEIEKMLQLGPYEFITSRAL